MKEMKRLTLMLGMCAALTLGVNGVALADTSHPSPQANCIGGANSNGQGEFASGLATTLPPGELGAVTSETLGGPHGLIGVVASSNDCS
jgi:hypothetical protein